MLAIVGFGWFGMSMSCGWLYGCFLGLALVALLETVVGGVLWWVVCWCCGVISGWMCIWVFGWFVAFLVGLV